jgi:hypothetical protein
MGKSLFIVLCTAVFAAIGFYVGHLLHEMTLRTLIATCAGALGGFGIGCVSSDVLSLWRSGHKRA